MASLGGTGTPGPATLVPGTVLFGEYEIMSLLGSGGLGQVYRAKHRSLGGVRAIKVIRPDLSLDPKIEENFVREAKALIDLHHDAIVRCHDLLRDDSRIYLVMELVEGPSLQRLLVRGPLPDDELMTLRRRILDGLAAMHARNIVHHDISPANIVLPNGQPDLAKLVDFGLAMHYDGKQTSGFQGNANYASPEQYGLFGGRVGPASDLYSLGLVLGEATTGEALLQAQSFTEAKEVRKNRVVLPSYVSPEVRNGVEGLLEADPQKRTTMLGDKKSAPVASDPNWLVSVLFTATSVGVGVGIGIALWLWIFTDVLNSKPAPKLKPSVSLPPPVFAGNPGPPPAAPPQPRLPISPPTASPSPNAGKLTRADVMAVAERMSQHSWICEDKNRHASCSKVRWNSDWAPNQLVYGIPYSWGGSDGPDEFDSKLSTGRAAGSHSWHGVLPCTAGIDCSGFVTACWGIRGGHPYTTRTLGGITVAVRLRDLKPGDALNRAGDHVVLFAGVQKNGLPIVYEANGAAARVIRHATPWSRLQRYRPVRYRMLVDS